jgi:hypothetical protein
MHILNENPLNPKGAFCEYKRFQRNLSAGRITADERRRKLSMVVMPEVKQRQTFAVNFETIIDCRECENCPGRFDGANFFHTMLIVFAFIQDSTDVTFFIRV